MSYHFLMDLALILLSTKILGLVAQKFQMPQVVGALIAGLILSPAGLGLLSETEFTAQLSELGVIVLMFSAGMGTDVNELKHSGKAGFMVAVLGVVVPFLMGTALAWGADELGLIETTGFLESVFTGTILTATSVSITVETLKEMKKLETKVGNTILAAALIDDVLGLVALTLVCSLAGEMRASAWCCSRSRDSLSLPSWSASPPTASFAGCSSASTAGQATATPSLPSSSAL